MAHPKNVGDRSALAVMFALRAAGYELYVPFGENTQCDLIVGDGTRLFRLQCKTGRLRKGAIIFNVCSSYAHHRSPTVAQKDYHGEIDAFGVYCHETRGVYLVPIEEVGRRIASLRVAPKNAQRRRIRLAGGLRVRDSSAS
jgi:PD-(D/E)XK nuclease superfamily protein